MFTCLFFHWIHWFFRIVLIIRLPILPIAFSPLIRKNQDLATERENFSESCIFICVFIFKDNINIFQIPPPNIPNLPPVFPVFSPEKIRPFFQRNFALWTRQNELLMILRYKGPYKKGCFVSIMCNNIRAFLTITYENLLSNIRVLFIM